MVRELGFDSAEAGSKESVHAAAPKTDAANTVDIKLFMTKSLIPKTEFGSNREA
jgi:hypothetical protein